MISDDMVMCCNSRDRLESMPESSGRSETRTCAVCKAGVGIIKLNNSLSLTQCGKWVHMRPYQGIDF